MLSKKIVAKTKTRFLGTSSTALSAVFKTTWDTFAKIRNESHLFSPFLDCVESSYNISTLQNLSKNSLRLMSSK